MAFTGTPQEQQTVYDISQETSVGNTLALGAGSNVRNGTLTLLSIDMDNSVAAAPDGFLKIYDSDGSALLLDGTDAPIMILPYDAVEPNLGQNIFYEFPDGVPFSSGLSYAAAEEAGKDISTTPAQDLSVRFVSK